MKAARLCRLVPIGLVVGTLIVAGCTSNSGSSSSSSAASMATGISKTMQSISSGVPHINNASVITSGVDKYYYLKRLLRYSFPEAVATTAGISSDWDPNSGSYPTGAQLGIQNQYIGNGFTCSGLTCTNGSVTVPQLVSMKSWIGQALDPSFTNSNGASMNVFGRLNQAMKITCVVSHMAPAFDDDGSPSVGSFTVNFPSDTSNVVYQNTDDGGCGLETSMAGQSIPASVALVSGTSFNKTLTVTVNSQTNTIYFKFDIPNGIFNFMSVEDQAPNRNAVSRTILFVTDLNSDSARKIMFEYASMGYNGVRSTAPSCYSGSNQWDCSFEFHRAYIDMATDKAYILSNIGLPTLNGNLAAAPDTYLSFSAAGRPVEFDACGTSTSCSEEIALSVGVSGQHLANGSGATTTSDYNGCVSIGPRSVVSDNTLSCNSGATVGTTIANGSGTAVIELSRQFYKITTSGTPDILSSNENTALSFSNPTNFFTSATAQ